MVDDYASGKVNEARDAQLAMNGLINALFIETNPIPVKKTMGIMNLCSSELREPLYPMSNENKRKTNERNGCIWHRLCRILS